MHSVLGWSSWELAGYDHWKGKNMVAIFWHCGPVQSPAVKGNLHKKCIRLFPMKCSEMALTLDSIKHNRPIVTSTS